MDLTHESGPILSLATKTLRLVQAGRGEKTRRWRAIVRNNSVGWTGHVEEEDENRVGGIGSKVHLVCVSDYADFGAKRTRANASESNLVGPVRQARSCRNGNRSLYESNLIL